MPTELESLAQEDFCYLTTIGRVSGRPHTIEIWFALHERTLYMLAGGREQSDWVKNIQVQPEVTVRIGVLLFSGRGSIVSDPQEDELARRLVLEKYAPRSTDDLDDWSKTSLPVAIHLALKS